MVGSGTTKSMRLDFLVPIYLPHLVQELNGKVALFFFAVFRVPGWYSSPPQNGTVERKADRKLQGVYPP